jgi:hypothetical protein
VKFIQPIRRLAHSVLATLRRRRDSGRMHPIDDEISYDTEWAHYRRERVPLCIATKHLRS